MFNVGDVIIYGTQGVCRIVGIEEKAISGAKKNYYVIKPVNDIGPTIFAPTSNENILKKMRKLLTEEEINKLIDSMPDEKMVWMSNVNERKELYKALLAGGDHAALIQMIKALYANKKEREAAGKRLHMMDENFFKDAERVLYNEFQYVLKLRSKDDLMAYILARLEKKNI